MQFTVYRYTPQGLAPIAECNEAGKVHYPGHMFISTTPKAPVVSLRATVALVLTTVFTLGCVAMNYERTDRPVLGSKEAHQAMVVAGLQRARTGQAQTGWTAMALREYYRSIGR